MRSVNVRRDLHPGHFDSTSARMFARSAMSELSISARASMVNRTHRAVRERARALQSSRNRLRSLSLPLLLCASLLILVYTALWSLLDQYEFVSPESADGGHQMLMLLLWFLPVSAALLAMVWYRRSRNSSGKGAN